MSHPPHRHTHENVMAERPDTPVLHTGAIPTLPLSRVEAASSVAFALHPSAADAEFLALPQNSVLQSRTSTHEREPSLLSSSLPGEVNSPSRRNVIGLSSNGSFTPYGYHSPTLSTDSTHTHISLPGAFTLTDTLEHVVTVQREHRHGLKSRTSHTASTHSLFNNSVIAVNNQDAAVGDAVLLSDDAETADDVQAYDEAVVNRNIERSITRLSHHDGNHRRMLSNDREIPMLSPREDDATSLKSSSNPCPEETANWLSYVTYSWLTPLLRIGNHRPLELDDMFDVRTDLESKGCSERFIIEWEKEKKLCEGTDREPSVYRALVRIYFWPFFVAGVLKICVDATTFVQPFLLNMLIDFLEDSQSSQTDPTVSYPPLWQGLVLGGGLYLAAALGAILNNWYWKSSMVVGMQVRTCLVTAIYTKSLKLSPYSRTQLSTGEIVNMMSNDASRIDQYLGWFHRGWTCIVQLVVASLLLWLFLGPQAISGMAIVFILIPLQSQVMKSLQRVRKAQLRFSDQRLKWLNEILTGIKVIKLSAWERSFSEKLKALRVQELRFIRTASYVRARNVVVTQLGPIMMSCLSFIVIAFTRDDFTSSSVFSALTIFNLLRFPLLQFPLVIGLWADARISMNRIQKLMVAEELVPVAEKLHDKVHSIIIEKGTFTWTDLAAPPTSSKEVSSAVPRERNSLTSTSVQTKTADLSTAHIRKVDLEIKKRSLTVVVGSSGCGKSSLLSAILGEMKCLNGRLLIDGSIGYAAQQAWIFNGTLRENILFGKPFNQVRYDHAVRVCSLERDFAIMPAGDQTEIGEKGLNLSGGQRQRVSLARLVYLNADICLLDDVLSAVDAHVAKFIMSDCILGALENSTRILVTHQLQYTKFADHVIYMQDGVIVEQGTYPDLMRARKNFAELMDTFTSTVTDEDDKNARELSIADLPREVDPQLVESVNLMRPAYLKPDNPNTSRESRENRLSRTTSSESGQSPWISAIHSTGAAHSKLKQYTSNTRTSMLYLTDDTKRSPAISPLTEVKISNNTIVPGLILDAKRPSTAQKPELKSEGTQLIKAEERAKGSLSFGIYLYYLRSMGSTRAIANCLAGSVLVFLMLQVSTKVVTDVWLSWWSDDTYEMSTHFYVGIYAALGGGQAFWALWSTMLAAYLGNRAAFRLHDQSVNSLLRAPLVFFESTPVGRIINRFSRDQDVIDSQLSDSLRNFIFLILQAFSIVVFIATILPYFLVGLVPVLGLYYYTQVFYRRCSREVKRLESITRSPLLAHFGETISGLPTIRAYQQQDTFIESNQKHMNANNRSYFILVVAQRWLGVRLESFGSIIVAAAALVVVITRDSVDENMAGLVMSYALQITQMYTYMTRQSVEVENNMNSVERSKFYADGLESEAADVLPGDAKRDQPETMWPSKGQIVLNNVSMKYRPELPLVLKNISITINPGERIGVVGRTGAGKTTLMSALFRLTEVCEGTIEIDGQNIHDVGLDQLRSRLAIIPQESVLWSGTIRYNLDPFNRFTDGELWEAIEQAHMKNTVEAMGGLEGPVQEQGENVSVGQRAQLCLARALLKKAKVLILDEATANVDLETDALIQSALLKLNCTVLAIAHRLLTIIEFDRVMVMQHGSLVEFDSPYNLLKNPNSIFSSLITETGPDNARMLRSLAERAEATRRKRLSITFETPIPAEEPQGAPRTPTSGRPSMEPPQGKPKQNFLQAIQSPYKFDQLAFSPSSSISEPHPGGQNGPNSVNPGKTQSNNPATSSSSERRFSDHRDEDEEYFIFSPQQPATANYSSSMN